MPSSHNVSSAVDIRTVAHRREKHGLPPYTDSEKRELETMSKPKKDDNPNGSLYSKYAHIESFNDTGEHLHVNVKTADKGE